MPLPKFNIPKKPKYIQLDLPKGLEFWELFRSFDSQFDTCFLLESAGDNQYDSRYSVIGFDPKNIIQGNQNDLEVDGVTYPVENPYYALRDLVNFDSLSISYAGGLVGYLSYNSMHYFEPKLQIAGHSDFPAMEFGLYLDGLIYDKFTGELIYFTNGADRSETIHNILNQVQLQKENLPSVTIRSYGTTVNQAAHKLMVDEALEEVKSGNTFQCQIGFEETFEVDGKSISDL
jgi:anthranilate synthase component 1